MTLPRSRQTGVSGASIKTLPSVASAERNVLKFLVASNKAIVSQGCRSPYTQPTAVIVGWIWGRTVAEKSYDTSGAILVFIHRRGHRAGGSDPSGHPPRHGPLFLFWFAQT